MAVKCLIELTPASLDGASTTLHMAALRRLWFYVPTYHGHSDINIKTRAGWFLTGGGHLLNFYFMPPTPGHRTRETSPALELSLQHCLPVRGFVLIAQGKRGMLEEEPQKQEPWKWLRGVVEGQKGSWPLLLSGQHWEPSGRAWEIEN